MIDALWPDLAVDEAAPRLHKAAYFARKAAGDDAVVLRGESVALFPDQSVAVDVALFEAAADEALRDRRRGAPASRVRPLQRRPVTRGPLRGVGGRPSTARPPAPHRPAAATCAAGTTSCSSTGPTRRPISSSCAPFRRGAIGTGRCASSSGSTGPWPASWVWRRARRRSRCATPSWTPGRPSPYPLWSDDLIGRDDERALISSMLGAVGDGQGGRTLLLAGIAGVGKSALLAWARGEAESRGWRTGHGVAAAIEGAWAYAPILEAVADLGRRHPALLDGLDDNYRAEIERALAGGDLHWSGEGGHQRLFVAVAELLRLAAADHGADARA